MAISDLFLLKRRTLRTLGITPFAQISTDPNIVQASRLITICPENGGSISADLKRFHSINIAVRSSNHISDLQQRRMSNKSCSTIAAAQQICPCAQC